MKRSMALNKIKQAGWDGDTKEMALIAAVNGIGKAASRKAFQDGKKMRDRGEARPETARK